MKNFKWVKVEDKQGSGFYTSTEIAEVPGGWVIRSLSGCCNTDGNATTESQGMVFVPKPKKESKEK